MVDFKFYLNRQGIRGQKGEKGDPGYSPQIVEGTNTINEYTLRIINEFDEFETPNLRGDQIDISDPDGTYVRYNQLTGKSYVGSVDIASGDNAGMIRIATESDFANFSETTAVTPASYVDNLPNFLVSPDNSVHINQNPETSKIEITVSSESVEGLTGRVEALEDDTLYLESAVNDLSTGLATTNANVGAIYTSLNGVKQDLTTEAQTRLNADNQQQQAIDAERQQRETQDAALQVQLNSKLTVDNIKAGNNIIISKDGNNVTITSTGGGGGGGGDAVWGSISGNIENQLDLKGQLDAIYDTIGDEVEAIDAMLDLKAEKATTYTKDEVDQIEADINAHIETVEGEIPTIATVSKAGTVIPDGTTITIDTEGKISAVGGGSVEVDNVTIEVNDEGKLQTTVDINELQAKVEDLQLYKFPNATIIGTPTINNGQISGFNTSNYLQFPFEFETQGRTWLLNGSFDTGSDVSTQQNVIDSLAAIALAVRNGRLVIALSTNGTTFDLGEHTSMSDIEANTKYYFKISFSGTQYLLSLSTDKIDYTPEAVISSSTPIASKPMTISSAGHPFGSIINLNDWDLTVGNVLVWQGMDDVGIASRMDVNASNITETGKDNIKEIAGVGNIEEALALLNGTDETLFDTRADLELSNINDKGKETIHNTNGLISGNESTTDEKLYNEVESRLTSNNIIDVINNYTVNGTVTVDDNGIVSGFSADNYISNEDVTLDLTKPWSLDIKFTTSTLGTSQGVISLGQFFYIVISSTGNLSFRTVNSTQTNWLNSSALLADTNYTAKVGWDGTNIFMEVTPEGGETLKYSRDNHTTYVGIEANIQAIGKHSTFIFAGSIDLTSVRFTSENDVIYQAAARIPCNITKAGAKIVDVQYKDRVDELFEATGEALYYVLDQDNKSVTVPKIDLYGAITRIATELKELKALLSASGTQSLATSPMMMSLETTELDVENSFVSGAKKATFNDSITTTSLKEESYEDDTDIDLGGNA